MIKYLNIDYNCEDKEYINNYADAVNIIKDYLNFKKCLKQLFSIANKVPLVEWAI